MKKNIKRIVVQLAVDNVFEIDVNTDIFDDPYIEAATQAIEQCKLKKYGIFRPIMECWEKRNGKILNKYMFNSYWILVNAALYQKAELLRERFKKQCDVDLSKEPIRGHVQSTQ